jgi:hypothetical protein
MKFYPLGDFLTFDELKKFGNLRSQVHAIYTDDKRTPKKGEWFLSGAEVHAYRARNDLTTVYHIAILVKTETVSITKIIGD